MPQEVTGSTTKIRKYPAWDPWKLFDLSPTEMKRVEARKQMRAHLKARYKKLSTNPHDTKPFQFDPAVQRWNSARVSIKEHIRMTPQTVWISFSLYFIPVVGLFYLIHNDRSKKDKLIRSGKLQPKDRAMKFMV